MRIDTLRRTGIGSGLGSVGVVGELASLALSVATPTRSPDRARQVTPSKGSGGTGEVVEGTDRRRPLSRNRIGCESSTVGLWWLRSPGGSLRHSYGRQTGRDRRGMRGNRAEQGDVGTRSCSTVAY